MVAGATLSQSRPHLWSLVSRCLASGLRSLIRMVRWDEVNDNKQNIKKMSDIHSLRFRMIFYTEYEVVYVGLCVPNTVYCSPIILERNYLMITGIFVSLYPNIRIPVCIITSCFALKINSVGLHMIVTSPNRVLVCR
jgi:hypothetical protein